MKAKRNVEEVKLQLELEVQELKAKLQHASQTLTAVRKQASDDFNSSYVFPRDQDGVVGITKSPGFSQAVASMLASSGTIIELNNWLLFYRLSNPNASV